MALTFDMNELREALRTGLPEIPADAKVRVAHRPGTGPGSFKNNNGVKLQPFVEVVFDLPSEEMPDVPS